MRLTRYGVIYERGFLVRKPLQMIPSNRNRAAQFFEPLKSSAECLVKKYEDEMGANAYALFNALTDFASRPPSLSDFRRAAARQLGNFAAAEELMNFQFPEGYSHAVALITELIGKRDSALHEIIE